MGDAVLRRKEGRGAKTPRMRSNGVRPQDGHRPGYVKEEEKPANQKTRRTWKRRRDSLKKG